MNNYKRQETQLKQLVNCTDELWETLKGLGAFIAGGAITSIFTNKEVNDLDVYFRDIDSLEKFIKVAFSQELDLTEDYYSEGLDSHALVYTGQTNKSVMFMDKNTTQVQLIHCHFHENAESIFDTFDFTINMGAYDFKSETFILHDHFLTDCAARRLVVNTKTSFPIISQLRIDKYKQRGYDISRKDFVKLSIAVANMKIASWEEATEAIGGMYGYNYDELFDTEKEFSLEELLTQVEELLPNTLEKFNNPDYSYDYIDVIEEVREAHEEKDSNKEYFYYKKVIKVSDGNYTGVYRKEFLYKDGESPDSGEKGIYLCKNEERAEDQGYGKDTTIIKLTSGRVKAKLVSDGGRGKFTTACKLTVVGEVK